MKVLILGHGEHGKDEAAAILDGLCGLSFISSSEAASEIVVYPVLKNKYDYRSAEECFADRRNHREEWRQLISEFNTPDKGRLCRMILEKSDCYVGMRCQHEFAAVVDLFDFVLWIDRSNHKPEDSTMTIKFDPLTMIWIDNNGDLSDLEKELKPIAMAISCS